MPKYPMYLTELFESVRPGSLYHCTSADSAGQIIHTDVLLAHTEHNISLPYGKVRGGFKPTDVNKYGNVLGVSLTRDPFFARRWGSGEGVVLIFDAAKLRQNYRLVPYDYYQNPKKSEAEEFLIGPMKPVARYLTGIMVSQQTLDDMQDFDDQFIEGHKPYADILNHPLLRVEGGSWDSMDGRIKNAA